MTIVVPAFNVERYLSECLKSLVAQTVWADCRVLVVDDGSTDGTGRIAADFAVGYPTISVLTQDNAGPGAGAARNHGLDEVATEFVLFVDGDDELTPRAIERLRSGLLAEGLNLAVGATEQFPEPRRWIWSDYFVPGQVGAVSIEDVPLLAHDARTCNKLYRTSWLRAQGLRFAEGIHHQDTVVNVPAMLLAERFSLVGDVVHRYRKRAEGGSVMDSHFTRVGNFWDHLRVIEELDAMRPRFLPSREPLMQAFIARSFQGFSWRACDVLPSDRLEEFFRRAAAVIRTLDPDVIEEATRDAQERTAYVTMLEDDLGSFERLGELSRRVNASDGGLYLDVPTTTPETRRLLRTGSTMAIADGVSAARDGITVHLSFRMRGLRHPEVALKDMRLRGMVSGEVEVSAPVDWAEASGPVASGTAFFAWSKLKDREYVLRLHLRTPTGNFARWVRLPAALSPSIGFVAGEAISTSLVRLRLAAGDDGEAHLTVKLAALLRARRQLGRVRRLLEPRA